MKDDTTITTAPEATTSINRSFLNMDEFKKMQEMATYFAQSKALPK